MQKSLSRDNLKAFAEKALHADRFPADYHIFRMFECDTCGVVPFHLDIEHHTGSRKGDFKGIIHGTCTRCGMQKVLFSFTGNHRSATHRDHPLCVCDGDQFWSGMCERYEGDEGLMGFFDEGVIVGQCARCGKNHVLAETD